MQALSLADMTVPYEILRADRLRLFRCPVTYTLGAYGFPDNGTSIIKKCDTYLVSNNKSTDNKMSKTAYVIILKGYEVYLYFEIPEDALVFHYMGEPAETRHVCGNLLGKQQLTII